LMRVARIARELSSQPSPSDASPVSSLLISRSGREFTLAVPRHFPEAVTGPGASLHGPHPGFPPRIRFRDPLPSRPPNLLLDFGKWRRVVRQASDRM